MDRERNESKTRPFGRRQHESRGTTARAALTEFSATNGRVKQNSCLISHRKKFEEQCDLKGVNNPEIKILESEPWLVLGTRNALRTRYGVMDVKA